jgi:hypothetical protein
MRRALSRLLAVLVAAACIAASASADEITVSETRLLVADDGIVLEADFDFELTPRLEDALGKGVPLYFLVEFECFRPRWYWFDERIGEASRSTRLSFHALTRTYRLTTGTLHQSFPTLAEAVRALGRVRAWQVLPRGTLRPDRTYSAYVRMRLDTTQLPKPFQVSALAGREWTLSSPWKRWEVDGDVLQVEARR